MYKIYCCFLFLCFYINATAQNSEYLLSFMAPNGQYGYKNASEQIIIEARFEEAYPFKGNYAFVKKNNAWGMINTKGKEVIPVSYEDIGWDSPKEKSPIIISEVLGYKQAGKWGLISTRNKTITSPNYDILLPLAGNKIKVGQISASPVPDTLYGVIDIQGKEFIPLQYHALEITPKEDVLIAGLNKIYNCTPSGELISSTKSYGLVSWTNTTVLPIKYKSIKVNNRQLEILAFNSWKLIGKNDSVLTTYALDTLYAASADQYVFHNSGRTGFIENEDTLYANKEAIMPEQHGFIVCQYGKKYGVLINGLSAAQTFLPTLYDSIIPDTKEFVRVGIGEGKDWKWEVVKRENHINRPITQQAYNWIEAISQNSLIKVSNNNLYGYINKQGTEVIPLQYDSLGEVADSMCVAIYKGKYGILHQNGKWVFEPKTDYFAINQFSYFIRKTKGKYEVIDITGKVKYTSVEPLQFLADGSISIKQKGKYGRISPVGVSCIPAVHDSISLMTHGHTFWAYTDKDIFLYGSNGELLVKPGSGIEEIVYKHDEEFLPARINGRYGFVDSFGRLRLSNRYEVVRPFEGNLAAVKLAGKWGFVNKQDKIVVQPYYDEVESFEENKVIAKKGDKYGIIDNKGKIVTPFSFDKITKHSTSQYIVEQKGKQGMLNEKGFEVIYAKYDHVFPQEDGKAIVSVANKYGLLNAKGIIILPPTYDSIVNNPFSTTYLALNKAHPFIIDSQNSNQKSAAR